jgi:hypothetical protein
MGSQKKNADIHSGGGGSGSSSAVQPSKCEKYLKLLLRNSPNGQLRGICRGKDPISKTVGNARRIL